MQFTRHSPLFIYFETNEWNPLQGEEPNRETRDQRKSNPSQLKPSRLPVNATTIKWLITPSDLSTITPANTSRWSKAYIIRECGLEFVSQFFLMCSLTYSQILAKSSCEWSPTHQPHKIEGKQILIPNDVNLNCNNYFLELIKIIQISWHCPDHSRLNHACSTKHVDYCVKLWVLLNPNCGFVNGKEILIKPWRLVYPI